MMPNPMMSMLQQLKANPVQFIMQRRLNIPQGMASDPNAIINHLLSTGQITQQQLNSAYQMMGQFKK